MDSIVSIRQKLTDRLVLIRKERFGLDEKGIAAISEAIGISASTWMNFERGIVLPAEILLKLILLTKVNPTWLATGTGPRYTRTDPRPKFQGIN